MPCAGGQQQGGGVQAACRGTIRVGAVRLLVGVVCVMVGAVA